MTISTIHFKISSGTGYSHRLIKKAVWLVYLCFFSSLLFAQDAARYPLIPLPAKLIANDGNFVVSAKTKLILDDVPALKKPIAFLNGLINNACGFSLKIKSADIVQNGICFLADQSIGSDEGYKLEVTSRHIIISYKTAQGAFWAIETLGQLMPPAIENKQSLSKGFVIPCGIIEDAPRFAYRGLLLDVSRHFFSIPFLKKYIDLLAFYKLNVFHLHLNDDQGWRVEIKKYPKLNAVGSWRKETLVGHRTDRPEKFDGKPHGGYYTQQELKDLVKYAGEHFVTIIPEIDIPGHSQAILAAYPDLGCKIDTTYTVSTRWGVHKEILCPTENTFRFLEDVLTEVMDIFPGKYIHIGGDEVPKDRWKESAYCQQLIKKLNLKDEHGLQSYFIQRIEKFINAKGRAIIGWDEILEGGLAPNATVMSWHGDNGGIAAARQNHEVIMTPLAYTYINLYQTKNKIGEPLSNGGFLPLEKVYAYDPVPASLTADQVKYILGTEACLWTEYISNEHDAEFMTFPRACALAEVGWTPLKQKNYQGFTERLDENLKHLENVPVSFAKFYQNNEGKRQ